MHHLRLLASMVLLVAFTAAVSPAYASNVGNAGNVARYFIVTFIQNGHVIHFPTVQATLVGRTRFFSWNFPVTLLRSGDFYQSTNPYTYAQLNGLSFTMMFGISASLIQTGPIYPQSVSIGYYRPVPLGPVYSVFIFYCFLGQDLK